MRAIHSEHGTKLWLSAKETYNWARKLGAAWPCSQLAGKRIFAEFDSHGDLVDMAVNGRSVDVDCNEFHACTSDFLRGRFGTTKGDRHEKRSDARPSESLRDGVVGATTK